MKREINVYNFEKRKKRIKEILDTLPPQNKSDIERFCMNLLTEGKSGISYNYVIHNNYAGVEIYLDAGKEYVNPNINKKRFDELIKHKEEIEQKFGDSLEWERLDEKRASRIAFRIRGVGLRNREQWSELQERMVDNMIKLEKEFRDYISKLE